jgi:hypothetical protein
MSEYMLFLFVVYMTVQDHRGKFKKIVIARHEKTFLLHEMDLVKYTLDGLVSQVREKNNHIVNSEIRGQATAVVYNN